MWGQDCLYSFDNFFHRIIPTRVGTRRKHNTQYRQREDHPHACGDKLARSRPRHPRRGSSPRVWGQVIFVLPSLYILRIIPTRVGTRIFSFPILTVIKDHPHACGDKSLPLLSSRGKLGSSPRVWGQDCYADLNNECDRIIPTRVGTSKG